jgi:hypothetical protein
MQEKSGGKADDVDVPAAEDLDALGGSIKEGLSTKLPRAARGTTAPQAQVVDR